jgi:hypothetical protein
MENLRGNIQSTERELEKDKDDEENNNDNNEKLQTKVIKRNHSTKTIEKNIAALNQEELECDHLADPLFHKMSQAFDEGGAKGMLMNNMVNNYTTYCIFTIYCLYVYIFIYFLCYSVYQRILQHLYLIILKIMH